MVNIKKFINSFPKESNNILEDIFVPITKRNGFIKSKSPVIPNYFYRYIGVKENKKEYYDELYKLDERLSQFGNLYLKFLSRIPLEDSINITNKTESTWKSITVFDDSQVHNLINLLKKSGVFPKLNMELLNSSLEESFTYVIKLYLKNSKTLNITQVKNFCCKLLQWINKFLPDLVNELDYRQGINKEIYNPKVLYYGDIKKHEAYFLIFLSKMSCDVLYINTFSDEINEKISYNSSMVVRLSKREELKEFPSFNNDYNHINNTKGKIISDDKYIKNTNMKSKEKEEKKFSTPKGIITSLKKSNNILEDIKKPLNCRVGFSSGISPIIPIYVYRYIGIKEKEEVYYNDLFKLDRHLLSLDKLYLKFTKSIPLNSTSNLTKKCQYIWQNINEFEFIKKDFLISALIQAEVFPQLNNKEFQNSVIKAFNQVLELFLKNETNINGSQIKNFSLKLLIWMEQYIGVLFDNFDYERKKENDVYNPKIIYYGDIKKHEAYFLLLLSKLGCDVLYINTNSDSVFSDIDKDLVFSQIFRLPQKAQFKEFPKSEIYIRQETTAYQASEEISKVLYSDEVGMYKPWQFEKYNLKAITLKTTFEELKILWKEPSKVRTSFRVENGDIYVPNLFAKISGVHEDLNLYCEEFQTFRSSQNTIFKDKIPFTKVNYSKNDLFSLITVFNREGKIDKEKLMENRFYKFSYLKTSIQNTIIQKINSLLNMNMFKKSADKELILKIVMTILNLDKEILQLIQTFDYPNQIPKFIIFDNDENIFSEEDSIVLAFLNIMGFDILIFTPTGYNNIEDKIVQKYYDTHKLEKIKLDFDITQSDSSKGKFNSLLNGLFRKK